MTLGLITEIKLHLRKVTLLIAHKDTDEINELFTYQGVVFTNHKDNNSRSDKIQ